jgi:hypothetical protein
MIGMRDVTRTRTFHGAAIVKAYDVKSAQVEVIAAEPPSRHAAITGWPWLDDPALQRALQKERATLIASKAILLRRCPLQ